MRDRLSHRGPDGHWSWTERVETGVVGLAHRRLSIIELSAAASQPMLSADRMLAIVYKREIYNFVELGAGLQSLGSVFRTRRDTEVFARLQDGGVAIASEMKALFAHPRIIAASRKAVAKYVSSQYFKNDRETFLRWISLGEWLSLLEDQT